VQGDEKEGEEAQVPDELLGVLLVAALVEALVYDTLVEDTVLEDNVLLSREVQRRVVGNVGLDALLDGPVGEFGGRHGDQGDGTAERVGLLVVSIVPMHCRGDGLLLATCAVGFVIANT
jgi:hypothetical protein